MVWVLQATFLNDYLPEKDHPQLSSRIHGIWHHPLDVARSMLLFKLSYARDVVDQRSVDGRLSGLSEDVAVNWSASIPGLWATWCEDCVCSEQDHHEPLLQEKSPSGGAKGPNWRPISSWKTDCVHDLRIHPNSWRSWSCSWLYRSIQCLFKKVTDIRDFLPGWIELCYLHVKRPKTSSSLVRFSSFLFLQEVFVCPCADRFLREEGHTYNVLHQESRDLRRGRGTGEVLSTCGESRSDPWQCAKGDSLQEERRSCRLVWSWLRRYWREGRFLEYVWRIVSRLRVMPREQWYSFEIHWLREASHNQLGTIWKRAVSMI